MSDQEHVSYKVIFSWDGLEGFERQVESAIRDGYLPAGGVTYMTDKTGEGWAQAVYRVRVDSPTSILSAGVSKRIASKP